MCCVVSHWLLTTLPLDGKASGDAVQKALGTFCFQQRTSFIPDRALEILHEMARDMYKSKRQRYLDVAIAI